MSGAPVQKSINRLKNNTFQKNSLRKVNLQLIESQGKNGAPEIAGNMRLHLLLNPLLELLFGVR